MSGERRNLVVIAAGGALGTLARYAVTRIVTVPKDGFPSATFVTNLAGAFVLGAFVTLVVERFPPSHLLRLFVATGLLGAFTTFSTMAVETVTLVKDGRAALGIGYLVVSVAGGLLSAFTGVTLARALPAGAQQVPPRC